MKRRMVFRLATPTSKLHYEAVQALRTNLLVTAGHVEDLIFHLRVIFADENFVTLLRAEGMMSVPSCLAEHLNE
jgi:hypothetical protein